MGTDSEFVGEVSIQKQTRDNLWEDTGENCGKKGESHHGDGGGNE